MRGNENLVKGILSELHDGSETDLKVRLFETAKNYGILGLNNLPYFMEEDYKNLGYNFDKSKKGALKIMSKLKNNYGEGTWLQ